MQIKEDPAIFTLRSIKCTNKRLEDRVPLQLITKSSDPCRLKVMLIGFYM